MKKKLVDIYVAKAKQPIKSTLSIGFLEHRQHCDRQKHKIRKSKLGMFSTFHEATSLLSGERPPPPPNIFFETYFHMWTKGTVGKLTKWQS